MKKMKVFDISDFPPKLQDRIAEKQNHVGGACSWYPGDGYFKPITDVKNKFKIHFYGTETASTPNVFIYEEGDGDGVGDWLIQNHGINCDEEVLIK